MKEDQGGAPPASADVTKMLERFQQLARQTQNPAYAWAALEYLFLNRSGGGPEWPSDQEFTLPGWLATYLRDASRNVADLTAGLDFRIDPPEPKTPLVVTPGMTPEQVMQSEEFQQNLSARKISADKAMAAVPAALGLTRDRWNAFASMAATSSKMQEFRSYQAMVAAGVPAKAAAHALATGLGLKDDASVYARLRDVKSLLDDN